jgi:hypothetical protein
VICSSPSTVIHECVRFNLLAGDFLVLILKIGEENINLDGV